MNPTMCSYLLVTGTLEGNPWVLLAALLVGAGVFAAGVYVGRSLAAKPEQPSLAPNLVQSYPQIPVPPPQPVQTLQPVQPSPSAQPPSPTPEAKAAVIDLAVPVASKPVDGTLSPPDILAIIAAVVRVTYGAGARIAQIVPTNAASPAVEVLMQHWSMEGRRQIYSSHQIR